MAVVVHRTVAHSEILLPALERLEATAVRLNLQGNRVTLVSVYSPPGPLLARDLESVLDISDKVILAGDLNSKNTVWGCRKTNSSGSLLYTHSLGNNYVILAPDCPTHVATNGSTDILDIALLKGTFFNTTLHVVNNLNSDHLPVVMNLTGRIKDSTPRKVYEYSKADWDSFRDHLDTVLPDKLEVFTAEGIDDAVWELTRSIQCATGLAVPVKTQPSYFTQIPDFILKLIRQRNRLRRWNQRHIDPTNRTKLNYLKKQITRYLTLHSSRSFQAKIERLDSTDRSLWTETRRLTRTTALIPPLKNAGITICSDEDKAELFYKTLC